MTTTQLRRSVSDRMVGGVASGLAAALRIDPVIIRLAFVALSLLNGSGLLIYMVMWLLVPREESAAGTPSEQMQENVADMRETLEAALRRLQSYFTA